MRSQHPLACLRDPLSTIMTTIDDPLTTPPANTVVRNLAGVGSGFGEPDRRREPDPPPQFQYLSFSAPDDQTPGRWKGPERW
jgi:hypothetical protein